MTEQEKRTLKARTALERGQFTIWPSGPAAWRVQNGEGGTYTIHQTGEAWTCTCPDFTQTCQPRGWTCKHIEGVRLTLAPEPAAPTQEPHMPMNIMTTWTTLTGRSLADVIQELKAILPPAAYKPVPGAGGFTDIDPSYLTEKATGLFGPAGLGWFYTYEAKDLEIAAFEKTRKNGGAYTAYEVNLLRFALHFRYVDAEGQLRLSEPILATGGNSNENRAYAIRGALTNAIGAAFAKLCWQLPVYQGLVSHENAGKLYGNGSVNAHGNGSGNGHKPPSPTAPSPKGNGSQPAPNGNGQPKTSPVKPAGSTPLTVEQAGQVHLTFGTKAHPEFKGQPLRDIIGSEDGRELARYLASAQWTADTEEKQAIKRACEVLAPTFAVAGA